MTAKHITATARGRVLSALVAVGVALVTAVAVVSAGGGGASAGDDVLAATPTTIAGALGSAGSTATPPFTLISLGGDASHPNAGINCSLATIKGNVAVANTYGMFNNMAPCTESGNLLEGSHVTFKGPGKLAGSVLTSDSLANSVRADALNAWAAFQKLTPTTTVPTVINGSGTLFGTKPGLNVVNVSSVVLGSGQVLKISGVKGAQWVINVNGDFRIDPGKIQIDLPLTVNDVVFNITSKTATVKTHGPNTGAGILLAPYNAIRIDLGPWTGEIIGGLNRVITLISGPLISPEGTTPPPTKTPPTKTPPTKTPPTKTPPTTMSGS